jgi:hypothetical protein
MGWIQGPLLKMKTWSAKGDPDEWFAIVKVTPDKAEVIGYIAENPITKITELESKLGDGPWERR